MLMRDKIIFTLRRTITVVNNNKFSEDCQIKKAVNFFLNVISMVVKNIFFGRAKGI